MVRRYVREGARVALMTHGRPPTGTASTMKCRIQSRARAGERAAARQSRRGRVGAPANGGLVACR